MSTPRSRCNRFYVYFLAILGCSNIAIAAEQTYVREYTYQASEADSKLSARAIALQEVKRALLSELGTHVSSLVKMQSSSDGTRLDTEEIETLSAGVTRVEILDEKWNGTVYVLKAQIKADPEEVLKSLHEMLDADKKQKQISQLGGDLSKIRTENIQIVESLTQSKKETTAALAEIARLKIQLEKQQTEASRQTLQTAYQQQVDQLTLREGFVSAFKYYAEGDYPATFSLFNKMAEQGFAPAQFYLGLMYANGEGVIRDAKQAAYWWQKAAEQGVAQAQFILGLMYKIDEGGAHDTKQAAYWFQKAAEQGHAYAQYYIGEMYVKGEGLERDVKQAAYWWKKSAEQGNASAQSNLGVMYKNGEGVARDAKQAVYWWQKAAEQGNASAQYYIGVMYDEGRGVARDAKQAVYWYQKAAEQGYVDAQFNLGQMYAHGDGVISDLKQGVYWIQRAAEQGDATAQTNLGARYAKGEGVARDAKQAVYWWQKAAEQGLADAQFFLGVMYDNGEGVTRDAKLALYWNQKAGEQGQAGALEWLRAHQ